MQHIGVVGGYGRPLFFSESLLRREIVTSDVTRCQNCDMPCCGMHNGVPHLPRTSAHCVSPCRKCQPTIAFASPNSGKTTTYTYEYYTTRWSKTLQKIFKLLCGKHLRVSLRKAKNDHFARRVAGAGRRGIPPRTQRNAEVGKEDRTLVNAPLRTFASSAVPFWNSTTLGARASRCRTSLSSARRFPSRSLRSRCVRRRQFSASRRACACPSRD